jgi:hypothetical protein
MKKIEKRRKREKILETKYKYMEVLGARVRCSNDYPPGSGMVENGVGEKNKELLLFICKRREMRVIT